MFVSLLVAPFCFRFMLKLINLQIKGSFEWGAGVDWVAKANDMMPAPFAELFDGEPDASRQRISRDLKLLDAVFAMSLAAYARLASPWNLEASHPDALALTGAKAVQKLIHVALQRMCAANLESQDYFGRRTSKPFGVITASAANAEVKKNGVLYFNLSKIHAQMLPSRHFFFTTIQHFYISFIISNSVKRCFFPLHLQF